MSIKVVQALDGRLLITDKKNIKAVLKEAEKDLVEVDVEDYENYMEVFESSYILVSTKIDIDGACNLKGKLK